MTGLQVIKGLNHRGRHPAVGDLDALGTQPPGLFLKLLRPGRENDAATGTEHSVPGQRQGRGRHAQRVARHARPAGKARRTCHIAIGGDPAAGNRGDDVPDFLQRVGGCRPEQLIRESHGARVYARPAPRRFRRKKNPAWAG
jgi:hypothetical protein